MPLTHSHANTREPSLSHTRGHWTTYYLLTYLQPQAQLDEFARDCNLKPESIKKAYKRFQATDKDKSGMIDYTEFCEVLQVDPSPQGERLFQLFDYEKSGQIDVREFMIALSNFTGAGKDDKLKFAFMIFDEDGNGVITKGELTRILRANHMAQCDSEVARKAEADAEAARVAAPMPGAHLVDLVGPPPGTILFLE